MDRREVARFDLSVPVHYTWKVAGAQADGQGKTRDISLLGIFVITDACPSAGSGVRLNVLLRSGTGDSNIVLRATATVVRVESPEDSDGVRGFAAMTENYVLETSPVIQ
jgi:hypothetical protein